VNEGEREIVRIFVVEDWGETGMCAVTIVVQYFHGLGCEKGDEGDRREGN
jgi:hypothetical protein